MLFKKKEQSNTTTQQTNSSKKKSDNSIITEFLHKASPAMDWMSVVEKYDVAEEVLDEYSDYIDWNLVCKYQNLREDFIESHLDKLGLENAIFNQNLSQSFIEKHLNDIKNPILGGCKHTLSEEFMLKNKSKINWDLAIIHQKFSIESLNEIMEDKTIKIDTTSLCTFQNLTEDFISKYSDKLDLEAVQKYQNLSYKYITDNISKFSKDLLDKYQNYKKNSECYKKTEQQPVVEEPKADIIEKVDEDDKSSKTDKKGGK